MMAALPACLPACLPAAFAAFAAALVALHRRMPRLFENWPLAQSLRHGQELTQSF